MPSNNVCIYSWNVAGLRAVIKKDGWGSFLSSEKPDILCLNETKVDDKVVITEKMESLLGNEYEGYFNCCQVKKGYSGVAIYTKYKPLSVNYGIEINKHDGEGRVITMEFEKFYLVATYIPNAGQKLDRLKYRTEEWDIAFQDYLEKLKKTKNVIWAGDINVAHEEIDIHDPKNNKKSAGFTVEERASFSSFLKKGWVDTFRIRNKDKKEFSYWSFFRQARENNRGWRLDYFVVDEQGDKNVLSSEILGQYHGSDHCPVKLVWENK